MVHRGTGFVRARVLAPAAASLLAGGCQVNESLRVGNAGERVTPEIVSGIIADDRFAGAAADDALDTSQAPSVAAQTLNRDTWAPRTFLVPLDGPRHPRHYALQPGYDRGSARDRGNFPTVASVLEPPAPHAPGLDVAEALAQPIWNAIDLASMPVRAVIDPPWTLERSPGGPRQRQPGSAATLAQVFAVDPRTPADALAPAPASTTVPGAADAPSPTPPFIDPPARSGWIFRDGRWLFLDGATPPGQTGRTPDGTAPTPTPTAPPAPAPSPPPRDPPATEGQTSASAARPTAQP